ncbi:hypothetical protein BX666DRAFT_2118452 [Dichotomocladium elegans]|nr:hypothetical protein BX666DRAFT_2118452 [Dichotomocladium elegans]
MAKAFFFVATLLFAIISLTGQSSAFIDSHTPPATACKNLYPGAIVFGNMPDYSPILYVYQCDHNLHPIKTGGKINTEL